MLLDSAQVSIPRSWKQVIRFAAAINPRFAYRTAPSAKWIEGKLASWLSANQVQVPGFVFLNLLDAHEPYFPLPPIRAQAGAPIRRELQLLDGLDRSSRQWTADDPEMISLHRLYKDSVASLCRRVRGIFDLVRAHGNWDNTLVVLTSDHGQAFGEGGALFHTLGASEQHLRVPLAVKFPRGQFGGSVSSSWASLVDLANTVRKSAGLPSMPGSRGKGLQELVTNARKDAIFAVADGPYGVGRRRADALSRQTRLNSPKLIAYQDSTKLIADWDKGKAHVAPLLEDFHRVRPGPDGRVSGNVCLVTAFGEILSNLRGSIVGGGENAAVSRRLTSWGYD